MQLSLENNTDDAMNQRYSTGACSLMSAAYTSQSVAVQLGGKLSEEKGEIVKEKAYMVHNPNDLNNTLPLLKEFKNPCFVQKLTSADPYAGVLHDKRLVQTDVNCARMLYKHRIQNQQAPLRMRCLPHFFLAGVQKCGTNEMLNVLPLHPQIPKLSLKENHWWNRARFGYGGKEFAIPMEGYLDIFNVPAEKILHAKSSNSNSTSFTYNHVTGDLSPALLWDQLFWRLMPENKRKKEPSILAQHLIAKVIPQAKFLLILRNPTDRLYSDWLFFAPRPTKGNNSIVAFHENVVSATAWMNNCTTVKPLRACFYDPLLLDNPHQANLNRGKNPWWNPVFRLRMGMYYIFLKDLLEVFPRNQVMVFRLEDYSQNRGLWLSKIYGFLGLEPYPKVMSQIERTTVHNQNKGGYRKHGSMLPETRQLLDTFYSTYNNQLAALLGDEGYRYIK